MLQVSADYGLVVAVFVLGTLALGFLLAKALASETSEATLLSSGTAICGGTAIATLAPIIQAKPHNVGVAMALVFLLNAVALLTFPYIGPVANSVGRLRCMGSSGDTRPAARWLRLRLFTAMKRRLWPYGEAGAYRWLILCVCSEPDLSLQQSTVTGAGFILLFILAAGLGSVVRWVTPADRHQCCE